MDEFFDFKELKHATTVTIGLYLTNYPGDLRTTEARDRIVELVLKNVKLELMNAKRMSQKENKHE